jgi:purine-cytosine permease-like protein
MVFGWLPILYGLGFWDSFWAIAVGTFTGSIVVSRTTLLGWRAATNNSVASGAFFGVKGRLVAPFVGLLLCIQYVALTVWTGGEIVSAGVARLTNSEEKNLSLTAGYLFIALAIVVFAIFGYRTILSLNIALTWLMGALILLSVVAFWPLFDASYAGVPELYALVDFWPTWLLAMLTAGVAGPLSFVTQTGDWSRYVSHTATEAEVVRSNSDRSNSRLEVAVWQSTK